MAKANKRRSTRGGTVRGSPAVPAPAGGVPEAGGALVSSPKSVTSAYTPDSSGSPQPHGDNDSDDCPACTPETIELMNGRRKESWIECDNCNRWYHWVCAGTGRNADEPVELENIAKWYCSTCTTADPSRIMTFKAPARKSSRKRTQRDYANLNSGIGSDPNRWQRLLDGSSKGVKKDNFKRMQGSQLEKWIEEDEDAMREPIIIEQPDGLGMKMPPRDLNVEHIAEYIGEDEPLEVIDVASQSTSPGWNLGKWADYVELDPSKRDKILNVISLEISGTELANMVLPPKIVRNLDWVENFWPGTRKGKNNAYPKVQLYCLMGVANAWTDWHIDFAGSSVYYHILKGSKIFYFIRPTSANLAAYEKWSGSELQVQTWLGDMVDEVFKVELVEGNTMIIPTGWIHAVYTPVDTIVFGGNFLHSYDVATQLRVREIEIATQVPKKFTFPMFTKLCWYTGDRYLRDLKSPAATATFSPRVLSGILALSGFLVSEARTLETGSDQAKKEAKEQIPSDRVKDGPAMARELRWRVKQAMGYPSDDEGSSAAAQKPKSPAGAVAGTKRRRTEDHETSSHFRNFRPKLWDATELATDEEKTEVMKMPKPEGEEWTNAWIGAEETGASGDAEASVKRRGESVVKVRRTATGVERQRIRRTVEEWTW